MLWGYSILHAAYIINSLPSKVTMKTSPYELIHRNLPNMRISDPLGASVIHPCLSRRINSLLGHKSVSILEILQHRRDISFTHLKPTLSLLAGTLPNTQSAPSSTTPMLERESSIPIDLDSLSDSPSHTDDIT